MASRIIKTFSAGALLCVTSCTKEQPTTNPPPPPVEQPPATGAAEKPPRTNPPRQPDIATEPAHLPTWDDVPSGHPQGATNPPVPVLVVTPEGTCHKRWQSPFMGRDGVSFDPHLEDCKDSEIGCGTRIQCTPEAEALKDGASKADQPK